MLRAMKDLGYNTVITTPHVMSDFYPNTRQTIEAGLKQVQDALKENNIDMHVCEHLLYHELVTNFTIFVFGVSFPNRIFFPR